VLRRSKADLLVLFGYTAISFAYFGWRLLPHPGRRVIGSGHDPQEFIWSFAWWPHAIGSWTNPFVTHAMYAPSGINLAWTPSAPGLALAFSPVTVLFGPVAAFNVAALLLPALSAWTAYLLCRYLTGSIWASTVGGYLFGFSTYVLGQQSLGHVYLTGVFVLPLVALVVLRFVRAELSARGLAWRLGVLLGLQFWISTEVAFTLTVFLAFGLALAFWVVREARPRLRAALIPIAGGYALAGVVAAPLAAYALLGFVGGSILDADFVRDVSTDLLSLGVPGRTIAIGGSSLASVQSHLHGAGANAYLGLPTLLIVAAFAVRERKAAGSRFVLAAFAGATLIALGSALQVYGHKVIGLPWWTAATHLPVLNDTLPFRLSAYVSLAAAVIVALWTGRTAGRVYARPYLLPALAVAALVPAVWHPVYTLFSPQTPMRTAFFADDLYKTCIPRGETLAIFPFGGEGNSMLWQAEAEFRFRLAEDGLQPAARSGTPQNGFAADPVVRDLNLVYDGRPTMDSLLAFAARHHVDRFLSMPGGYPSRAQMRRFGPTQLIGGMLVSPACGQPSLARRDLTAFVAKEQHSTYSVGYCLGLTYTQLVADLYPAGPFKGAKPANFVAGAGLTCAPPPAGYTHRGFATPDMGVPAHTYAYYAP
jgi:hypothetical protein